MDYTEWEMEGVEMNNCNCSFGCPCQFNEDPTHGDCRGYAFVQIDRGHYGDVSLNGLRWGIRFSWPGPIHEGGGVCQSIIDDRADPDQRAALEAISQGRDTEPGKLIWQIFSTTMDTFKPTLIGRIDMNIDMTARSARVRMPGVIEGQLDSIPSEMNPHGHHATVTLPNGFEFTEAEFVSGTSQAAGDIELNFEETHAHLCRVHWSTHGVVR